MPDEVRYHVLRTAAELEALTPAWRKLWQSDSAATPFQHPDWLLPWWHCFSPAYAPDALRAVTLHRGEALIGLLPLYLYRDDARDERQLLLVGAGTSDYLDGVFAPECTGAAIVGALDLLDNDAAWDVAHLSQLRPHSRLREAILFSMPGRCVQAYDGEATSCCKAVPVGELPKKLRADVRYFRNAATGLGKLALGVADGSSCSPLFESLVRQHTARWQNAGEPGVLAEAAVLAWHREAVPRLQASGLLRLYSLCLDREVIAVLYALIDPPGRADRALYTYLNGYAPEHADSATRYAAAGAGRRASHCGGRHEDRHAPWQGSLQAAVARNLFAHLRVRSPS